VIARATHIRRLLGLIERHPVVAILGARQVGKTTLARELVAAQSAKATFFDLENPDTRARLREPMLTLDPLRGLVVLDEIQRVPEIFPVLRVLADRPKRPATFLVSGSASPELLRQSSESLAGRIVFHELGGFTLDEVGVGDLDRLWLRGGFPRSFLSDSESHSREWRDAFIRTFLERDIPQLGFSIPSDTLRRFWMMVAHYHGQVWNGSEIARSLAVSEASVRRYADLLSSALVVDQLQPWHEKLSKRQVKSPRVFVSDSGLLHALLGTETLDELLGHPKLGASWEGFAIRQVVRQLELRAEDCFFWATHAGAELDLLVVRGRKRWGFEFKRTSQPAMTKSMSIAMQDLGLRSLTLIHAGPDAFPLAKNTRAVPLRRIGEMLRLD
jgi:predicted AAA+ superfamily ATPase